MWLLVVFFSLTQDKFDIVKIYTPPPNMKFLATPLNSVPTDNSS